ncbi:MAG TPA: PaaI family thioesterase [Nocardioidaceae bacterium]|nr:PaaI family thioesterase [Nocardioidaceae bacterium]
MTDLQETTDRGFISLVGARSRSAEDGRARLELAATEEHLNEGGTVHGGLLATLVDTAMGAAVRSSTGDNDVPATSQLTVTYLRPGKPGTLVATAEVRKQGADLTVCEAEVEQDGRTLAHALATFAVLHR